ncbi:MAG TPA: coproporphyrinogen III oxidase, partial [Bryobacteraceae bacterium]|nr:coproporphyrinogen III oxidase [Bryobacteraceae bacterium]
LAGRPHQTMESWNVSLDWIERLAPEHVSVDRLEVDEDSRLGLEILQGGSRYGAAEVPDEDASADFYEIAVRRLRSMGIERYEISNFARPGFESKHNLKYWTLQPYAGFGADAHSFDGQMRRSNPESVSDYLENRSEASEFPARPDQERLFTGLRLDQGIELSDDEWTRYGAALLRFEECGLVKRDGCHVRLTDRGVLLSSEVFQEFVGA